MTVYRGACDNLRGNVKFGEEEVIKHVHLVLAAGASGDMPSD